MRCPERRHPAVAPLIAALVFFGSNGLVAADDSPVRGPVIERRTPTPTPRLRPNEPLAVPTATPTPRLRIDEPLIVSTPTMEEQPQSQIVTPPPPPTLSDAEPLMPEGLAHVDVPELAGVAETFGEAAIVRW